MYKVIENKDCKLVVEFEIDKDKIELKITDELISLQKNIELPGFRKGKAPLGLIKRKYEKNVLENIISKVIHEEVNTFLSDEKVRVVTEPVVYDVELEQKLHFKVEIEYHPTIAPKGYLNLNLKKIIKKPNEKDVKEAISALFETTSKLTESDSEYVEENHIVAVNYRAFENNKFLSHLSKDNILIDLSQKDLMPEIKNTLIGMKRGEVRKITLNASFLPFQQQSTISFEFMLNGIKEKIYPSSEEEIAKELGLNTADELRKKIENELSLKYQELTEEDLKLQILNQLISVNKFSIPKTLLTVRTREIYAELLKECYSSYLPFEFINNKDELFKKALNYAFNSLCFEYLLNAIGEKENIEVSSDEVEEIRENLSKRLKLEVKNYTDFFNAIVLKVTNNIRMKKIIDFIIKNSKIKEEIVE